MNKLIVTVSILLNLLLITAADFKSAPIVISEVPKAPLQKKSNCGYTIIEFGKGIDCHGDTIKLARVNGVQIRVDS